MATRAQPLGAIHWTGAVFAALVMASVLGPLGAVMLRARRCSCLWGAGAFRRQSSRE